MIPNVTAVESSARAESDFWAILDFFDQAGTLFVVEEPVCDFESPSWALKPLFWVT